MKSDPRNHLPGQVPRHLQLYQDRAGLTCSVPGCDYPIARRQFGLLCSKHRTRYHSVGHPTGKSLKVGMFDRWRRDYARPFLEQQARHQGIINAIALLDTLIKSAEYPRGRYDAHMPVSHKSRSWFSILKDRGVEGRDVLEGLIACYAIREYDPRQFADDRHWRHQVALRVIGLGNRGSGGLGGPVAPNRTSGTLREHLFKTIHQHVGLLALRAAREIVEQINSDLAGPAAVEGSRVPFAD